MGPWSQQNEHLHTLTYSSLQTTSRQFYVLGKGGFGTVYLGYIEKSQVAIKMLSSSSIQGFQQFQAEARWSKQIDLTFFYQLNHTPYCILTK